MRLFTGLSLSSESMQKLQEVLSELRSAADVKWSPAANLHITTKFIGEWPEARLEELSLALAKVSAAGPIRISLSRFGFFPNPHHPHALFAGVQAGPELSELANRIDEAVAALGGKKEERPYLPHVTLARIKNQSIQRLREQIASMTDFDFGTFQATEFHLYESKAGTYSRLASYPLVSGEGKRS